MIETVVTTTQYERSILKSPAASPKVAPSTDNLVASITLIRSGNKIGNESTGYRVPFEFAFDMIAAMNVEAVERPKVPITTVMRKIKGDLTVNAGMVSMYATIIIMFKTYMSRELKRSLPIRTEDGSTHN